MLKEPTKHHALHLATIRERCTKNPHQILKNYHAGKLQKQAEQNDTQIQMESLSSLEKMEENNDVSVDTEKKKGMFTGLFGNKKASKFAV